jgi:hypothetical protein
MFVNHGYSLCLKFVYLYVFNSGTEHENEIRKAIPVWQKYSCLSFSENKQAYNRIEFELAKDNMYI